MRPVDAVISVMPHILEKSRKLSAAVDGLILLLVGERCLEGDQVTFRSWAEMVEVPDDLTARLEIVEAGIALGRLGGFRT